MFVNRNWGGGLTVIKAYRACEKDGDINTVVFAESANKAKTLACISDCFEGVDYIDIRVQRMPEADKLYKGMCEINWDDQDTRITLVRDFHWSCYEPSWECDNCQAKQYCKWHVDED